MPAGLIALRNDCVASVILKPAGLIHRSSRGSNLRACPPNACHQIPVRKTEMEADNLRMELHDKIAHFVVEGSAVGGRKPQYYYRPPVGFSRHPNVASNSFREPGCREGAV